jgi:hypothetical protein
MRWHMLGEIEVRVVGYPLSTIIRRLTIYVSSALPSFCNMSHNIHNASLLSRARVFTIFPSIFVTLMSELKVVIHFETNSQSKAAYLLNEKQHK